MMTKLCPRGIKLDSPFFGSNIFNVLCGGENESGIVIYKSLYKPRTSNSIHMNV